MWPEVGHRASLRVFEDTPGVTDWIVVQEGTYRYLTAMPAGSTTIRMVIGEYLAAEVVWD
jgi:hypothetical protein